MLCSLVTQQRKELSVCRSTAQDRLSTHWRARILWVQNACLVTSPSRWWSKQRWNLLTTEPGQQHKHWFSTRKLKGCPENRKYMPNQPLAKHCLALTKQTAAIDLAANSTNNQSKKAITNEIL